MASLARHRRAILGALFAGYLAVGAWKFHGFPPGDERGLGIITFAELLPELIAVLIGAAGLLAVVTARRGEPLDRRPVHAASAAVGLFHMAVVLLLLGRSVGPAVCGLAGLAFLGGALFDWGGLFTLLSSASNEHLDTGPVARLGVAPIVSGLDSPVVLFAPNAAGYREDARGKAIAAVPADRSKARARLVGQVVVALGSAFVALPAAVYLAVPDTRPAAPEVPLAHTTWRGDIDFGGGSKNRFRLEIETAQRGQFTGVMDWGDVAANVEGTYDDGGHLVFYDRSLRRTSGVPFVLDDRKDVRIVGDEMTGTDKAGRVPLRAVRVR